MTRPTKLLALVYTTSLLGACALLPVQERSAPDFNFLNSVADVRPSEVIYMDDDQLNRLKLPALPHRRTNVDAQLIYRGSAPQVRLEPFMSASRPSCPVVRPPASLAGYGNALRCGRPAGGQPLTEVALRPNQAVPMHLEGTVLDQGLKAGTLYIGLRILEGQQRLYDRVDVTQTRIRTRL